MATVDDVRALGSELERSYPVRVRGRLKFRVGSLVYVAFSLDESVMGFAFPKEERDALVGGMPEKFELPSESDMRFPWVHARMAALEPAEARSSSWMRGGWSCRERCPTRTTRRIRVGRGEVPGDAAVSRGR